MTPLFRNGLVPRAARLATAGQRYIGRLAESADHPRATR
jgi:hypothetical protein